MIRLHFVLTMVPASLLLLRVESAVIAQWTFNSREPDSDPDTGSLDISSGTGVAWTIGNTSQSFGSVSGGATSDPDITDNSQIRIARFPAQGTTNKGAGIEFHLSTVGYQNLRLSWDQQNSASASRFLRVQYTADGRAWQDYDVISNTNSGRWLLNRSVNFGGNTALNNNANAAIRFVPEFESTATGGGAEEYLAVGAGAAYSTAGTLWLDMVTFRAEPLGSSNSPPWISPITNRTVSVDSALEPISFSITDEETPPEKLIIRVDTSNPQLISDLRVDGDGTNRLLIARLEGSTSGETLISIRITDEAGATSATTFSITVSPSGSPLPSSFLTIWSFNSIPPDESADTGTLQPAAGDGTARLLGALAASFGTVAGGKSSDTTTADNSMLRLSSFPPQGTDNKTSGLEFRVSTARKRNIGLVWDQYNSASASRYWRVQYTTNGSEFLDHTVVSNTVAGTWLRNQFTSFGGVANVENNPNFGIRFVSEFESSATAAGEERYLAVSPTSNYSVSGTLWIDLVRVAGEPDDTVAADDDPPVLIATLQPDGALQISWRANGDRYLLERTADVVQAAWERANAIPTSDGEHSRITLPLGPERGFYRLRRR
jgi:hypothetical protein